MDTYARKPFFSLLPLTLVAPPATLVTALLFFLMHSLIATDMEAPEETVKRVDPVILTEPPVIEFYKTQPPVKPVEATPPPEYIEPKLKLQPQDDQFAGITHAPAPVLEQGPIGYGGGGIVAYLKPQPVYPARLLSRGVEGHVDLAFDITPAGSTTNIRVIDAQPQGAFEKAAIKALQKWKYKVPIVDEEPQGQVDMMTRMTFRVEA